MSVWRKAMNYLGLGPDDAYYDDEPIPAERPPARAARSSYPNDGYEPSVTVRPAVGRGGQNREHSNVREMPVRDGRDGDGPTVNPRARQGSAVRTVAATATAKPFALSPKSFNAAQEVGDRFRDGQPVIVNLEGLEKEISRRIIDFTSGLCYALNGRMERVASGVYLLTPASVEVSDEERRRYSDRLDD